MRGGVGVLRNGRGWGRPVLRGLNWLFLREATAWCGCPSWLGTTGVWVERDVGGTVSSGLGRSGAECAFLVSLINR